MTTGHTEHNREQTSNTAQPGMIDTIIHLGTATTNLAIDQVGNAFTALVHPGKAIDHVKETLQNLSNAMDNSASSRTGTAGHSQQHQASDLRGASDGMDYVSREHTQTPFSDVRKSTG